MSRANVSANPGGTLKVKGRKRTRVDHFKDAVAEFPNLFRSVPGLKRQGVELDRWEKRQLSVEKWERPAQKLC